jgi:Cof subfamily protein (haloacid dehalogenase superfamily)
MDLVCFDLDGTLLNESSQISPFTRETLALMRSKNIAYTVATGRTMLSAKNIIQGHDFDLPQVYNNGVTVWHPEQEQMTLDNLLGEGEIATVLNKALSLGITPFVHAIQDHHHLIYHPAPRHDVERTLIDKHYSITHAKLFALEALPADANVTNISMIGEPALVEGMWEEVLAHPNLVAYSGPAMEGKQFRWMDIHHCLANKGTATTQLKAQLGASNLICFGDSDNDRTMFEQSDECYAPANAKEPIKALASQVIGFNHEDGVAHFLRERFSL